MRAQAYMGTRTPNTNRCVIIVKDAQGRPYNLPLNASLKLFNHSPDGFEWGYYGSGPAQLALAMLLDFTGDPGLALQLHQEFKGDVIAKLPQESWTITDKEIKQWLTSAIKNKAS